MKVYWLQEAKMIGKNVVLTHNYSASKKLQTTEEGARRELRKYPKPCHFSCVTAGEIWQEEYDATGRLVCRKEGHSGATAWNRVQRF